MSDHKIILQSSSPFTCKIHACNDDPSTCLSHMTYADPLNSHVRKTILAIFCQFLLSSCIHLRYHQYTLVIMYMTMMLVKIFNVVLGTYPAIFLRPDAAKCDRVTANSVNAKQINPAHAYPHAKPVEERGKYSGRLQFPVSSKSDLHINCESARLQSGVTR